MLTLSSWVIKPLSRYVLNVRYLKLIDKSMEYNKLLLRDTYTCNAHTQINIFMYRRYFMIARN